MPPKDSKPSDALIPTNDSQPSGPATPPDASPGKIKEAKPDPAADSVVQLTRNAVGHQVGETFKTADAQRLGITKHCRPFPGANDRALAPGDLTHG